MRVLLDANVLLSYLLAPDVPGTIQTIVEAALGGRFDVLLPEELLNETLAAVQRKPSLRERISVAEANALIMELRAVAELLPRVDAPLPRIARDPKDDYLIAQALLGRADILVSGDRDLLALADLVLPLKIVHPADFARMLSSPEAGSPD